MRVFSRIFILFWLLIAFANCKKKEIEKEEGIETIIETKLKPLNVLKTEVLKAGLGGYNYGYPDMKVVNVSELLIITSRFKSISDNSGGGHLIAIRSFDKGATWTEPVIIQNNIARRRTVAPTILKITETHLILTFSAQHSDSEIDLYFKESFDGGYTWTEPAVFSSLKGYNISNNSSGVYQNSQITVPVAFVPEDIAKNYDKQSLYFYTSNDLGKSWQYGNSISANFALMEPYINTFEDGEALVNIRTKSGYMYFARKKTNEDWVLYNSKILSPASPQKIFKYPNSDKLIMLWNYTDKKARPNRSPLSLAISDNRGHNWTHIYDIETSGSFDFAYSAIDSDEEYVYLSYYKKSINSTSSSSLMFCRLKKVEL